MRRVTFVIALILVAPSVFAKSIPMESLEAQIAPDTVGWLYGLGCRNYDRIVHVDISLDWPSDSLSIEPPGPDSLERLVFWNNKAEYLFPKGSYTYQHGVYRVKGYFIASSGGMHQGILSIAFMKKVDDAQILLNPAIKRVPIKSERCDD